MIEDSDKSPEAHEDLDPVRVAREAVAQMYEGSLAERMAAVVREGSLDNNPYYPVKDAILGARAMKAACEAAGAKPVGYRQLRTIRGMTAYSFSELPHAFPLVGDDVTVRGPEEPLYAHPPAVAAGRVKALEWLDDGCDGVVADTPIGSYELHKTGYVDDEEIELSINLNRVVGMFGSTEDDLARAAAQTDYEQRILSALEGGRGARGCA